MRVNRSLLQFALTMLVAGACVARAEGPADALLPLVPPDAGITLAVEDLSDNARAFFASPFAKELHNLPAVQGWLASPKFQGYRKATDQIEQLVGENIATIRDKLLGEAVVLALRLPPDQPPDQARGLLLARVADRDLLDRLLDGVNMAQTRSGELAQTAEHHHAGILYHAREFRGGVKPTEYYTILEGRVFAWSNSEELILGAIDRKLGRLPGLDAEPKFRDVRRRLPARAAVSLFVDPRFVERMAAASPKKPRKPGEARFDAMLARYLAALRFMGVALQWQNGFLLHTHETIDPDRLDPWFRRLAGNREPVDPKLRRVPESALAMMTAHADVPALFEALRTLVPEAEQGKLDNLLAVATGLLLGRDVHSSVLPHLGPGVLAYLERPAEGEPPDRFAKVLAVSVGGGPEVSAALENALRTLLAFSALDEKRNHGQSHLELRTIGGIKVTALDVASPFAFAISDGRLAIGSTPEAAARALLAEPDNPTAARVDRLRADFFPEAETFACVDLRGFHQFVSAHRAAFATRLGARPQPPGTSAAPRDLDQALALMNLFRGAFAAAEIAADATAIHRTIGLIAREAQPATRP